MSDIQDMVIDAVTFGGAGEQIRIGPPEPTLTPE